MTEFIGEFEQFPNAKNDDIVDTLLDAIELAYKSQAIDYDKIVNG